MIPSRLKGFADRLRARASHASADPMKSLEDVILAGLPEELALQMTEAAQAKRNQVLERMSRAGVGMVAAGMIATAGLMGYSAVTAKSDEPTTATGIQPLQQRSETLDAADGELNAEQALIEDDDLPESSIPRPR